VNFRDQNGIEECSKHKKPRGRRLSAEQRLQLYKEFICSCNRRQLSRQWGVNPTTVYDIARECEANMLAFFQQYHTAPKRKGSPRTLVAALERIRELEEKCAHFEADLLRFRTRPYLGEAYRDRQFPLSQEEFISCVWIMSVLQGKIRAAELEAELGGCLGSVDIRTLVDCVVHASLRRRNRALVILSFVRGIPKPTIAKFLRLSRSRVAEYIERFEAGGIKLLLNRPRRKDLKKSEDPKYKDEFFAILHAPQSCYGINRTTWKIADIARVMVDKGLLISMPCISGIIKEAGYQLSKAKRVLTSTDPNYREKLREITRILSQLKPDEKFFSIDEYGPFQVKMQGGRSYVPKGQPRIVPQWQKSKGILIVTAALELSTNQITHFYSEKKNTDEMIKLLAFLLKQYKTEDCIYFSWDAAKWHASKKLYRKVDEINSPEYREENHNPLVKLAPLPAGAQFLNVIESVFSGMAKAIIHNSDYQSVE